MPELPERVARTETRIEALERDMADLQAEVVTGEGIAPRKPLRSRVHDLESNDAAAKAAQAALAAVLAERKALDARKLTLYALVLTVVNVVVAFVPHPWG